MPYIPKFKTEGEASSALDRGEATREEKDEATYYQTYSQQQQELNRRLALGETGAVARTGATFSAGDFDVHAKFFADDPNAQFIEYEGGGVKYATPEEIAGLTASGKPVYASSPTEQATGKLAIKPIEGKEIKRTGQTVKNPETGVDVQAPEGSFYVEYADGTVELRSNTEPNKVGEATPIGKTGQTAEELGIDRNTEIKAEDGSIARAPYSAAEEMAQQGGPDNSQLEYIGREYTSESGQKRVAAEGNAFYQDPATRKILERPDTGADKSLPSTSPSVLASRNDVAGMFRSVYGREPNQEELSYWEGRTDKTGDALLGALEFAKQEGKSIGGQPQGEMQPVTGDQMLAQYGIQPDPQAFQMQPIKSFEDTLQSVYQALGLNESQTALQVYTDELKDLDSKLADEIEEINRNPWYSEGDRSRRVQQKMEKYDTERAQMVARVQLIQSFEQSRKEDAKYAVGLALQQFNADRSFDFQQMQAAEQRAQNSFSNQLQLANLQLNKAQLKQSADQFMTTLQENQRQFGLNYDLNVAQLKKPSSSGGSPYAGIKEVQGGLYNLNTGQWIVNPKTSDTPTLNAQQIQAAYGQWAQQNAGADRQSLESQAVAGGLDPQSDFVQNTINAVAGKEAGFVSKAWNALFGN